jgi:signal transduction histidine kinase
MTMAGPVQGLCDAHDCLIEADPALAGLHMRCGGDWPGVLAVPALLALVRRTRVSGVAQLRMLRAVDEGKAIAFLARATPEAAGTRLALSHWRLAGDHAADAVPADDLLIQMAVIHAVLDADQRVLAVDLREDADDTPGDHAALHDLVARWRSGGPVWSETVDLVGVAHRQPLHWRLIDDVALHLAGSARLWRARLLPHGDAGFDLLVLPDAIAALPGAQTPAPRAAVTTSNRVIGRDLAPALRQPINRIIANAETIRTRLAGPLADDYAGYAADIAEAGRHLLALVEDLADLDAVEAPDFAPAPDHIDLADCARRASGILAMRARERGITLMIPADHRQMPATGEFRRVLQVLLNLLTNAIRYSPEHSTVSIEVGGDAHTAWVAVSDEGEGMTEDQTTRVFEKFERLGRSGDGGSGLGLYISRRLARAMGGELTVAAGPGARFVLNLPGRAQ